VYGRYVEEEDEAWRWGYWDGEGAGRGSVMVIWIEKR